MFDLDSLPEHIRRPDLRPVQPIPLQHNGQPCFGLRDMSMLSRQMVVVPPQVLMILQQFRGKSSIEEIAQGMSGSVENFVQLARGLDEVGLLWGPTFEQLESDLSASLRSSGVIPVGASVSMGADEASCRARIQEYLEQTEDPEIEGEVLGLVAPHLDYDRGWPNYAAAYHLLRAAPAPDRVVILGTNHFGMGDGVVLTEYGFETPMGQCPPERDVLEHLMRRLGRPIIVDQLDHMAEHSIQLQLPWLQFFFGNVPLVAALIPDPLAPMIDGHGERVDGPTFIDALREVLEDAGGRTLVVGSSDLSHVGPQFGEPRPVDDQRRFDTERHDRDLLGHFVAGDAEEFLAAACWTMNPTRWCSVGNMAALLRLVQPQRVELIDYRQSCDERGTCLVSSAALVVL